MRQNPDTPPVAVVMGVAGTGKPTVGERLAQRLDWEFIEGDPLYPAENVAKLASGHPLTNAHGVVTSSALQRKPPRRMVGQHSGVRLDFLPPNRLDSQFDARTARAGREPDAIAIHQPAEQMTKLSYGSFDTCAEQPRRPVLTG